MDDLLPDIGTKVAVNAITEVFKSCFEGFKKADEWFKNQKKKYDFLGSAAANYTNKIVQLHSNIRIFGLNEPIPLKDIYTYINVSKIITSQRRTPLDELKTYYDRDKRLLKDEIKTIYGIRAVNELQKFVLLGKPGSGKTTFLKYLILQAVDGNLAVKRIPIYISLKDLSDHGISLIDFIMEQFDICDFPKALDFIERILQKGKCLILLDGLDEVTSNNINKIINIIKNFSDKYNSNQFIITCRVAAYYYCFESFIDVEMADFNDEQIFAFVNNWFGSNKEKAKLCWKQLKKNPPIKELGSLPLLLTLLCIAFDETMDFPSNKAELYKDSIDALLRKWDASRNIKRDDIYRNLSARRKESLFSRIAYKTFTQSIYFISQRGLERYIQEFIQNLPEAKLETLEPDSESILKAIEAQHGIFIERSKRIYSFSHLSFQEYFTAKYLVEYDLGEEIILKYLYNYRWEEVIMLTTEMLDNADTFILIMKAEIDSFVKKNDTKNSSLFRLLYIIDKDIISEKMYSLSTMRAIALFYIFYLAKKESDKSIKINLDYLLHRLYIISLKLDKNFQKDIKRKDKHFFLNLINCFNLKLVTQLKKDIIIDPEFDLLLSICKEYLRLNKLIIDCINSKCYLSKNIREKILNELLIISK